MHRDMAKAFQGQPKQRDYHRSVWRLRIVFLRLILPGPHSKTVALSQSSHESGLVAPVMNFLQPFFWVRRSILSRSILHWRHLEMVSREGQPNTSIARVDTVVLDLEERPGRQERLRKSKTRNSTHLSSNDSTLTTFETGVLFHYTGKCTPVSWCVAPIRRRFPVSAILRFWYAVQDVSGLFSL
jgi:hypothetical protein